MSQIFYAALMEKRAEGAADMATLLRQASEYSAQHVLKTREMLSAQAALRKAQQAHHDQYRSRANMLTLGGAVGGGVLGGVGAYGTADAQRDNETEYGYQRRVRRRVVGGVGGGALAGGVAGYLAQKAGGVDKWLRRGHAEAEAPHIEAVSRLGKEADELHSLATSRVNEASAAGAADFRKRAQDVIAQIEEIQRQTAEAQRTPVSPQVIATESHRVPPPVQPMAQPGAAESRVPEGFNWNAGIKTTDPDRIRDELNDYIQRFRSNPNNMGVIIDRASQTQDRLPSVVANIDAAIAKAREKNDPLALGAYHARVMQEYGQRFTPELFAPHVARLRAAIAELDSSIDVFDI
jgi:hypothetical protein